FLMKRVGEMAKKPSKQAIEDDLRAKLAEKGCDTPAFEDLLSEYMDKNDELADVKALADSVAGDPKQGSLYIRCISRISSLEKDKRDILKYLGIYPGGKEPEKKHHGL
ncbi:MAG: hypothetical protein LUD72_01255, partial [Bacteroidales bacterium]|nr:hypothetical protein [Bacteroidales bacterium]